MVTDLDIGTDSGRSARVWVGNALSGLNAFKSIVKAARNGPQEQAMEVLGWRASRYQNSEVVRPNGATCDDGVSGRNEAVASALTLRRCRSTSRQRIRLTRPDRYINVKRYGLMPP